MRVKINPEDEAKFFKIMMHLDKSAFSCRKEKEGEIFYISESSYETLIVNGVKPEVLK